MPLPQLLGFEVLAVRRAHHLPAHELFDEVPRRLLVAPRSWRRRRRLAGVLPVDARNAAAQRGELFLDILHSPFLCLMVGHASACPQLRLCKAAPGVYSRGTLRNTRLFFAALAALLVATRLCHLGILWEGDSYPLAAAGQMLHGKALYREIWFDKPPLLALAYLLFGAAPGWPLRLFDAAYAFAACWIAWRFARDLWSEAEAMWAAG